MRGRLRVREPDKPMCGTSLAGKNALQPVSRVRVRTRTGIARRHADTQTRMHSAASDTRRSIGDIKLLNQQRWARHVAAQQQQETSKATTAAARLPAITASPWGLNKHVNNATAPVPTAGALFNRPNPIAHDHTRGGREYVTHPYNRREDKFLKLRGEKRAIKPDGTYYDYDENNPDQRQQLNERGWDRERTVTDREGNQVKLMPVYGSDWFSVNPASIHKRRIPNTSVVNKIGDLRMPFCCWGVRLTAAQWSIVFETQTPRLSLTAPIPTASLHPRSLVDQFDLLHRAHHHDLHHAAHGLLALGPVHVARHGAHAGAHLSHLPNSHGGGVHEQPVRLVAGVQWHRCGSPG